MASEFIRVTELPAGQIVSHSASPSQRPVCIPFQPLPRCVSCSTLHTCWHASNSARHSSSDQPHAVCFLLAFSHCYLLVHMSLRRFIGRQRANASAAWVRVKPEYSIDSGLGQEPVSELVSERVRLQASLDGADYRPRPGCETSGGALTKGSIIRPLAVRLTEIVPIRSVNN